MRFLPFILAWAIPVVAQPPVNVALISVDTLRADRLGCYGYALSTSPNLDVLAQRSLLFEDAVCEVPLTNPSMTAMLSSRYPRSNGVTRNGLRLGDDVPLVQEQFHTAGYQTFAVLSNWTLKRKLSGLDRGFEIYEDNFHKKRWGFIKAERDADEVTRLALELLEKRDTERPFFAWFHYSDPHAPYKLHRGHNPAGKLPRGSGKVERVRARYDSEVAYTDAQIQQVLKALPENTAVLFVADHGESLYEHDYLGHGRRIYQDNLHIPFMIKSPGVEPGRSKAPVRGVDVAPTLLGIAGLQRPPGMMGLDVLRENIPQDRARVVETYGGAVPGLPGAKAIMADAPPMRQGVLLEQWKLIIGGEEAELYSLPEDQGELKNLDSEMPEKVEALRELIRGWDDATHREEESGEALDAADVEALRSLGYIE